MSSHLDIYQDFMNLPSKVITVYHGRKMWSEKEPIYAPAINYQVARGNSIADAITHVEGLLTLLTDFRNKTILNISLYNAQVSGYLSPFVSATRYRNVARSFAIGNDGGGFVLTIRGPQEFFYDFNMVRDKCRIPHRPEFMWLGEMGIPIQLDEKLELVQVDQVYGVEELYTCVYRKDD